MRRRPFAMTASILLFTMFAQCSTAELSSRYQVLPDTVYLSTAGMQLKADLYLPYPAADDPAARFPTLIYVHGGGWISGTKEAAVLRLLPYLRKGWAAVNVQYRLGTSALAPAAVQDARCALRWVQRNADRYGFDRERIVVSGHSAGGHLALLTGMLTPAAGLDDLCPERVGGTGPDRALLAGEATDVAAVINWAGITDVGDLISGPNATRYAVAWLGGQRERDAIALQVSPLTWVREALPPILTLHGELDQVVPYAHAKRLHDALDAGHWNRRRVPVDQVRPRPAHLPGIPASHEIRGRRIAH